MTAPCRCGQHDTREVLEAFWQRTADEFLGTCEACSHEWRWHTRGGMCQGTADGIECHCVMMRWPS